MRPRSKKLMWATCVMCVAVLVSGTVSLYATGKSETPKKTSGFVIGFANGYFGNTWRAQFLDDTQKTADTWKQRGILKDFNLVQVNNDITQQIVQLNSLLDQGVDCLIINPVSAEALAPIVKRARGMGVLIVNVDDPFAYEGVISVITDQKARMGVEAKMLFDQLHKQGGGNFVYISGLAGNPSATLRDEEVKLILKDYPDIHMLAQGYGGWDETKAQEVMSSFLAAYPKIDGVLCHDIEPLGILRAYEIAGKPVPLMNMDYLYGTVRKWSALASAGNFQSSAATSPPTIGSSAIEVAMRLLMGWKLKPGVLKPSPINPSIVSSMVLNPPYVITNDGQIDPKFLHGPGYDMDLVTTTVVSLKQAMDMGANQPDSAALEGPVTDSQIDTYFVVPAGAKW